MKSFVTSVLVEIITNDGRVVVGILKGLDQVVNVVLANTEERVFTSEGIDKQQLGLYLIRGDNVAIVGKIIYDHLLNCTVQSVSLRPRYGTDSKPD